MEISCRSCALLRVQDESYDHAQEGTDQNVQLVDPTKHKVIVLQGDKTFPERMQTSLGGKFFT